MAHVAEKQEGVILWVGWSQLKGKAEAEVAYLAGLGAKGLKIDFMDRDDQVAVRSIEEIAAALRRGCTSEAETEGACDFAFGSWRIDGANCRMVGAQGEIVALTAREVELLRSSGMKSGRAGGVHERPRSGQGPSHLESLRFAADVFFC